MIIDIQYLVNMGLVTDNEMIEVIFLDSFQFFSIQSYVVVSIYGVDGNFCLNTLIWSAVKY